MKRAFDCLLIIISLPILLPVVVLVALVVMVTLGRPVFFVQARTGKDERPFMLYKFRTMRVGAGSDEERLTRVGRILRATSVDELPELWNVLKGEMSIVGPRPMPVRYLPRYTTEQRRRHEVRPGITGWAQVNGRNMLDWATKFRYDVEYVERQSFGFDLRILALTVGEIFRLDHISHAGEATMTEFLG